MKKVDAGTRNIGFYAAMAASYTAALPMVNGALMQLFLADKGLNTVQIGTFATIVQLSTLIGTIVFSKVADRSDNPKRDTGRVLLIQMVLSLCYMPLIKSHASSKIVLFLATCIAAAITLLAALKSILEYKMPYQIIPLDRYGSMLFTDSAIRGIVGIALSFCFSQIIAERLGGQPYFWCMVLATGLLLISEVCCHTLKSLEEAPPMQDEMATESAAEPVTIPGELHHVPFAHLRILEVREDGSFAVFVERVADEPGPFGAGEEMILVIDPEMIPAPDRTDRDYDGTISVDMLVEIQDGVYDAGINTLYAEGVFAAARE